MRILDAEQTSDRLPYVPLARAIADVMRAARDGRASAPERLHLPLDGGGVLLVMPAADEAVAVNKTVTVHPDNHTHGLPAILGEVLAMDAKTGRRLGLLDGGALTVRRTAALSLLAAQTLAPPSDREPSLLLFGAGAQARGHLEAFVQGMGVTRAGIASRTMESAGRLADHARSLGVQAEALSPLGDMAEKEIAERLADARFIVTATTSLDPLFSDESAKSIRDDAFVAGVGAFKPAMAELPAGLLDRGRVYVDSLAGAGAEAGDLIRAGIDWAEVTELDEALDGPKPELGPVVFKSVGHALFDLAAARLALEGG